MSTNRCEKCHAIVAGVTPHCPFCGERRETPDHTIEGEVERDTAEPAVLPLEVAITGTESVAIQSPVQENSAFVNHPVHANAQIYEPSTVNSRVSFKPLNLAAGVAGSFLIVLFVMLIQGGTKSSRPAAVPDGSGPVAQDVRQRGIPAVESYVSPMRQLPVDRSTKTMPIRDKTAKRSGAAGCSAAGADYLLAASSRRILSESDLAGLSAEDLRIARNEIYARHGYRFKTDMKYYFACKPWYRAQSDDVSGVLSSVEKANIALIRRQELH
jgi:hypothetical protein